MSPVVVQRAARSSEERGATDAAPTEQFSSRKLKLEEVEGFTRNLMLQLDAGVPLLRALESQRCDDNSTLDTVVTDLASQIEAGQSFGGALERWPFGFPKVYSSLVHAGERSGRLEQILGELAAYLAWLRNVRKTIKKALTYPTVVAFATFGLVIFLMTWLIPRFAPLFERLGDSVPVVTQILIDTSTFMRTNWVTVLALSGGVVFLAWVLLQSDRGRRACAGVVARAPLTSGVIRALEITRLTRNLSILSSAGIPIVDAIELARDSAATAQLENALTGVHDALLQGASVADAFEATAYFPRDVNNLIVVGEEAGRLADVLGRLADHYDEVARERVDAFVASIEPITTILLGLIVGGVSVAILTTLYQVMQSSGKG